MPGGSKKKKRSLTLKDPATVAQLAQERQAAESRKRQASRPLPSRSPSPDPPDACVPPGPGSSEAPPPGLEPTPPPDVPRETPFGPPPAQQTSLAASVAALVGQLAAVQTQLATMSAQLAKFEPALQAAERRAQAAEDRAAALAIELQQVKDATARADQRQEGLDRAQRRDKMIFFGLAEASGDNAVEQVREHLRAVSCPAAERILEAVRLGPARAASGPSSAAAQRPVRVTFSTPGSCYDVFKCCRALREQRRVFVDRDLTAQQRAVRASLKEEYKLLRENGYRPFWRGERLFYAGESGARAKEVRSGDALPTNTRAGSPTASSSG